MKSKEEAIRFVYKQMRNETPVFEEKWELSKHVHYGWMEIKELLEFIYGYEFHNSSKNP